MEELKKSANFTRPVEQNNNHGSPSPMEMQDMNIPSSNSPIQDMNNYASNSPMQNRRGQSDDSGARSIVNENRIPHSEIIQKKVVARNVGNYNHRAGRDVILLSVIGQSVPVAKATVQRTTRCTVVGGTSLGTEYCEVIVNYVLKKNAPLPQPYNNITKMGDAKGHSIAWPYERMEDDVRATNGCASIHRQRNQDEVNKYIATLSLGGRGIRNG